MERRTNSRRNNVLENKTVSKTIKQESNLSLTSDNQASTPMQSSTDKSTLSTRSLAEKRPLESDDGNLRKSPRLSKSVLVSLKKKKKKINHISVSINVHIYVYMSKVVYCVIFFFF